MEQCATVNRLRPAALALPFCETKNAKMDCRWVKALPSRTKDDLTNYKGNI